MMLLKACPHCGGDLSVDYDHNCGFLECVQCGHILSRSQELALGVRITRDRVIQRELLSTGAVARHAPISPRPVTQPKR